MNSFPQHTRLTELSRSALAILPAMFQEESALFSHKTLLIGGNYENRGTNVLYSAIALIGILEQSHTAPDAVVPLGRALDGLHATLRGSSSISSIGTAVWASVLAEDRRAEPLVEELLQLVLRSRATSMDLALGLAGLMSYLVALPSKRARLQRVADACAADLLARISPRASLFRGQAGARLKTAMAAPVTSFASQVYPLHGLALYARKLGDGMAEKLGRVGDALAKKQGRLGQWWWFYSSNTGAVLEGYPVYAVHQDAMAFMALMPLISLGVGSHEAALARGIEWLFGANELHTSLVREDPPFVSRCIQRAGSDPDGFAGISRSNRLKLVARGFRTASAKRGLESELGSLEILEECRPYHLGWILYAHSLVSQTYGSNS